MTMTRLWTLIGILAVIVILAAGYAVGVGPAYSAATDSDSQLADVEIQNGAKLAELARLKALSENSDELLAELEELQRAIPTTHNTSVFALQLAELAAQSKVELTEVAYTSAEPALAPETAAPPAPASPAEGDAVEEEVPSEATPGSAANTQAVPSVPGLVALSVTVGVEGNYSDIHAFLERVQNATRSLSVGTVTVDEASETGVFELKVTGYVYVLPGADMPVSAPGQSGDGEAVS